MVNALKSKKVYIIGSILGVLGYIPFVVAVIMATCTSNVFESYPYVEWAILVIYLLVGFVWGDQHSAQWERKNKKYGQEVPPEVKTEAWKRSLPFYFGALLLLFLCIGVGVSAAANGFIYPFTETII